MAQRQIDVLRVHHFNQRQLTQTLVRHESPGATLYALDFRERLQQTSFFAATCSEEIKVESPLCFCCVGSVWFAGVHVTKPNASPIVVDSAWGHLRSTRRVAPLWSCCDTPSRLVSLEYDTSSLAPLLYLLQRQLCSVQCRGLDFS